MIIDPEAPRSQEFMPFNHIDYSLNKISLRDRPVHTSISLKEDKPIGKVIASSYNIGLMLVDYKRFYENGGPNREIYIGDEEAWALSCPYMDSQEVEQEIPHVGVRGDENDPYPDKKLDWV